MSSFIGVPSLTRLLGVQVLKGATFPHRPKAVSECRCALLNADGRNQIRVLRPFLKLGL